MKRGREKNYYFASFTSFVDDYELGNVWADPSTTDFGFFSTKEKAQDFLCSFFWDIAKKYDIEEDKQWDYGFLYDWMLDHMEEDPPEYLACDKYSWELKDISEEVDKNEVKKKINSK